MTFAPTEIKEWVDIRGDGELGVTALCPHCGIDAVLPENDTIAIAPPLLDAMRAYWFK